MRLGDTLLSIYLQKATKLLEKVLKMINLTLQFTLLKILGMVILIKTNLKCVINIGL